MDIVVFALAALTGILAITALAVPLSRWTGLPLPVMLAAWGLGYGILTSVIGFEVSGSALDAYDLWFVEQLALDASTLLYIFLPPLLFEMALAVNVRRLFDDISTVFVMAVLAVLATTVAVGTTVAMVSTVPIVAALMLGAAVATTDPGAVISTFREIGAPRRLLVILEGESLLNDAAAIAIFTLLIAVLGPDANPTTLGVIFSFLYSFGAGAAVGLAVAWLAGRIYPLLGHAVTAEASITMVAAYASYMVAELAVGGSGVVAVVFAGLATGTSGLIQMGPGNWPVVRAIWAQIGFWANAVILVLVASLTPGLLISLEWDQLILVVVIYLGAFFARAWVLFGVVPLLAKLGLTAPLNQPQKVLVLWGGVRGPVTLVLALSISDLAALQGLGRVLAALAAAYTITTLFMNAATLALVTRMLGLDRLSPTDLALRESIVAGAIERVRKVVSELARKRDMEEEALAAVEEALGQQRLTAEAQAEQDAQGERIPFGERLRLGLTIYAGQEWRLIRRAFEEGAIGPRATGAMRLIAERLADGARLGGRDGYEAAAMDGIRPSRRYRMAVFTHRWLGFDGPLRAQIELQFTKLLETDRIIRELRRFGERTLVPMIGEEAAENLNALLDWREAAATAEFDSISAQYPKYARDMEQTLITRVAIRRERQQYQRLLNDGVIGQELHDDLARALDRRERVVARPPRLDLTLTPRKLIEQLPLFDGIEARERRMLARALRTRFTTPGQVILSLGQRGSPMYFIASGAFRASSPLDEFTLTQGDFFGELGLIQRHTRRRSTITSLGYCRLLELSQRDFERLGRKAPGIAALIRGAAVRQLQRGFVEGSDPPPRSVLAD